MAAGNMGGANGSLDDDKKKKSAFAKWMDDKSSQMNAVYLAMFVFNLVAMLLLLMGSQRQHKLFLSRLPWLT